MQRRHGPRPALNRQHRGQRPHPRRRHQRRRLLRQGRGVLDTDLPDRGAAELRIAAISPRVVGEPTPVWAAAASPAYARRTTTRSRPGASSNRPAFTRWSICSHTTARPSSVNQPAVRVQCAASRRHARRITSTASRPAALPHPCDATTRSNR